jgi:hypothetical protein
MRKTILFILMCVTLSLITGLTGCSKQPAVNEDDSSLVIAAEKADKMLNSPLGVFIPEPYRTIGILAAGGVLVFAGKKKLNADKLTEQLLSNEKVVAELEKWQEKATGKTEEFNKKYNNLAGLLQGLAQAIENVDTPDEGENFTQKEAEVRAEVKQEILSQAQKAMTEKNASVEGQQLMARAKEPRGLEDWLDLYSGNHALIPSVGARLG